MESDFISIRSIQNGDITAFNQFFESFYPSLLFFARKYLHDEEASLDIVQDAFIYFWNKKKDIHSISAAKGYLFKYVKNRSLNYLRDNKGKEKIDPEKIESEIYFRDVIIEDETYQIIYKAIESLSPQGQQVIELTLEGMKNHEIASHLNISVNTVKTIKQRAFKTLRTELKTDFFTLFMICFADNHFPPRKYSHRFL
jgi:RNA polymerase sigma-70 factor (ECF subfamily)